MGREEFKAVMNAIKEKRNALAAAQEQEKEQYQVPYLDESGRHGKIKQHGGGQEKIEKFNTGKNQVALSFHFPGKIPHSQVLYHSGKNIATEFLKFQKVSAGRNLHGKLYFFVFSSLQPKKGVL